MEDGKLFHVSLGGVVGQTRISHTNTDTNKCLFAYINIIEKAVKFVLIALAEKKNTE